ncbi:MAG: A/G-specific adenine glycosylase [Rickettsiales bacterium]
MSRISSTPPPKPQIKPAQLRTFHRALAKWYKANGRHNLPWRTTNDPYHIWVSEVMLQQTQVATVLARFYHPFLASFPTVEALANAPEQAVMKAWEGLGYYSRARNLHAASKQIVSGGWWVVGGKKKLPLTTHYSRLISLPGIGRNTAHAILAFGYHQPVAILEANVKRIVARAFAWEKPNDAQLWAGAAALLNRAEPFDYNQAMMDVGSLICTPKNPRCTQCPLYNLCKGKAEPTRYPAPKARKKTPLREVDIEVLADAGGRLYLERRAEKLLGGLYGFAQLPRGSTNAENLGEVKHVYSHFTLMGRVMYRRLGAAKRGEGWFLPPQIAALPLSGLDRKVLALVEKYHSSKNAGLKS